MRRLLPRKRSRLTRRLTASHRHEANDVRGVHLLGEIVAKRLDAHAVNDGLTHGVVVGGTQYGQ